MKRNIKLIIGLCLVAAILATSSIITFISKRIPSNDISVVGNTAGNLYNDGLFVESEGKVYFSNVYDHGCIYSMNSDETDFKKINTSNSKNLLCAGDYLYYYMDTTNGGQGFGYVIKTFGIYRSKTNGKNSKCLDREASITAQLIGDNIYFQRYTNKDFTKTYKVRTDKSEISKVSDAIINPSSAYNGAIYFNGNEKDHYLYKLDTRNDTISTIFKGDVWNPQYVNGYVYYTEPSQGLRLCRYNISSQQVEILSSDFVETFNVSDRYIYYQRGTAGNSKNSSSQGAALMRMGLDGSSPEVIMSGTFNSINITSNYVYFKEFGNDSVYYHQAVNGPVNVSQFTNAMEAALRNE